MKLLSNIVGTLNFMNLFFQGLNGFTPDFFSKLQASELLNGSYTYGQ